MFLPDGGGGGTHRASRNVALIVFLTFWFLASSRVPGQSVSGRFSHLNLFVVIFWIPIFDERTERAEIST